MQATPYFSLKQSHLAGVGGRSWLETAPTRPALLTILALYPQRTRSREDQVYRDTYVASSAVSHHSREPVRGQVAGLEAEPQTTAVLRRTATAPTRQTAHVGRRPRESVPGDGPDAPTPAHFTSGGPHLAHLSLVIVAGIFTAPLGMVCHRLTGSPA